jgi:hypothetical protein
VKVMCVALLSWLVTACGTVGSPIPPEDVGVTPTIERQKKFDADAAKREAEESQPVLEPLGQDVELPPLRPVGTR